MPSQMKFKQRFQKEVGGEMETRKTNNPRIKGKVSTQIRGITQRCLLLNLFSHENGIS